MLVFKRKTKKRQKITQMKRMNVTKLKKLRLPELNKYLNHHGLGQHLKSSKSDIVKTIQRCSCLQQKSPLTAGQPTLRNVRTLAQNDNRASADSVETDENENEQYDSDTIDPGEEHDSFLHSSIQMRKMPMIGQMPHAPRTSHNEKIGY